MKAFRTSVVWAVFCLAFLSIPNAALATEWLYSDAVQPDWNTSNSYDVDVDASAVYPSPHSGEHDLQAIYTASWGAVHFENVNGGYVGESGDNIIVWFYDYDTNHSSLNSDVEVTLFDTNGNVIGTADFRDGYASSLSTMQWNEVEVPLADLGAEGETIGAVELESANLLTMYFDDIHFTGGDGGGSGGGGTTPPIQDVYTDSFGNTWDGWMWYGTNVDFSSTGVTAYEGTYSTRVKYEQAGDSLEYASSTGFNTSGYDTLSFAVNGGSSGGEDITVILLDQNENEIAEVPLSNYVGQLPSDEWKPVNIPLSDLSATNTTVAYVDFYSTNTTGDMYYDKIEFTNTGGSGGGGSCDALQTEKIGMQGMSTDGECVSGDKQIFFDDGTASGTNRWTWNVPLTSNIPISDPTYGGSGKSIEVDYQPGLEESGNAGVQFYSQVTFNPNPNTQDVVFALTGNISPGNLSVSLVTGGPSGGPVGNVSLSGYTSNCSPTVQWCLVRIPMGDLINCSPTNGLSGFTIESTASGTEYFDNVYVAPVRNPDGFLTYPIHNGKTPYTAIIQSAFDHSVVNSNNDDFNCSNNVVVAYTGEKGSSSYGHSVWSTTHQNEACWNDVLYGWAQNSDKPVFSLGGQYDTSSSNEYGEYLFYDGHSGYDWSGTGGGKNVYASASGTVTAVNDAYNTLYIDLDSPSGYRVYYLHLANRYQNGQHVTTSDVIGTTSSLDLHFTVKKYVNGEWVRVDPYGWLGIPGKDPWKVDGDDNICLWTVCK